MVTEVALGSGRGWLRPDAAASLARIDAQIGHPLQITEAGRTYAEQLAHWNNYQRDGYPIALPPWAPSIHQVGAAIDTDERLVGILGDHGWVQTVWRDGILVEPWHFEYEASRDNHYGQPAGNDEVPAQAAILLKGTTMEFAVKAASDSGDGLIRAGQTFAVSANAPITIMAADEVAALDWFEAKNGATPDKIINYRLHPWTGDRIRALMKTRGYFPWSAAAGRTDYTRIEY